MAIAGILFYMEKHYTFKETKNVIAILVVLYFLISCVMYYLTHFGKFKNNKYSGINDAGEKVTVYTWTTKFDPIYNVKVVLGLLAVTSSFEFMKMYDRFGFINLEAATALFREAMEKKSE